MSEETFVGVGVCLVILAMVFAVVFLIAIHRRFKEIERRADGLERKMFQVDPWLQKIDRRLDAIEGKKGIDE